MRILVCGGRDFYDKKWLNWVLLSRHPTCIIQGGARGADCWAAVFAQHNDIPCETYHADWARYFNRAGPIRNAQMLADSKPDLVIAFPGGRGTADMVAKARKAGVPVEDLRDWGLL